MSHRVTFTPAALRHLDLLEDYIANRSGSRSTSHRYIRRILAACSAIGLAPYRGTRRDDIAEGLRTTGFERRITILFAVEGATVLIVGIYYGGQQPAAPSSNVT